MEFRTSISLPKSTFQINYDSKIMSLGSCFAVNMAEKLDYFKFQNSCNPFGILFHPLAIEKLIDFAVSQKQFTEHDIFFYNERWHCFDAHSDLSTPNKEELIANLNRIIQELHQQIMEGSHFIITYGTSWVYRNLETDVVVANCHKVPQKQFSKELLSVATIEKSIQNTIQFIQSINPNAHFIFTVSPVRHLKDGFVENQGSKAHLITALYHLKANYFPSYEIMMDELRDYRFYAEDMMHPNSIAIDYIWKRFLESNISEDSFFIMEEVSAVQKALAHRAFNPNSESHLKFLKSLEHKKEKLQNRFPFMLF